MATDNHNWQNTLWSLCFLRAPCRQAALRHSENGHKKRNGLQSSLRNL